MRHAATLPKVPVTLRAVAGAPPGPSLVSASPRPDIAMRLCSAAIEVAPVPPERLLAMGVEPAAAFIAPGGDAWVGLGVARWLAPGRDETATLWAGLRDDSPEAPAAVRAGCAAVSCR